MSERENGGEALKVKALGATGRMSVLQAINVNGIDMFFNFLDLEAQNDKISFYIVIGSNLKSFQR